MLDQLTAAELAALRAIVKAPQAMTTVEKLGRGGHAPETLESLASRGLVVVWTPDPTGALKWGVAVEAEATLTPWGAAVLRVEIVERIEFEAAGEALEVPRWAEAGTLPPNPRAWKRGGERGLRLPEMVQDTRPGPIETAIAREEAMVDPATGRVVKVDPDRPGRPLLVMGAAVILDARL